MDELEKNEFEVDDDSQLFNQGKSSNNPFSNLIGTLTNSFKRKKNQATPPSYYVNYTLASSLNLLCVAQAMMDFMPAYF